MEDSTVIMLHTATLASSSKIVSAPWFRWSSENRSNENTWEMTEEDKVSESNGGGEELVRTGTPSATT